jgi:hypothetical protein
MKWMWSAAFVAVAVSAVVSAQSGKEMNESKMGNEMNVTYLGLRRGGETRWVVSADARR